MTSLQTMHDKKGHAVAQWLRHYATSPKIAGSRSEEVIENLQFT
jgi:hypothetical protein